MDAQPATGARKAVDTAFYDLFDLSPDATSAQIKRAYYKRARECHPDKHPNDAVKEAEFKKLSQAYQTLFDEERRAVYDALGRDGLQSDDVGKGLPPMFFVDNFENNNTYSSISVSDADELHWRLHRGWELNFDLDSLSAAERRAYDAGSGDFT